MGKDLVRKIEKVKPDKAKQESEANKAAQALADRLLFGAAPQPEPGPPRIILGIDATTSMGEWLPERKLTLETARIIAEALYAKAGSAGLQVQLAFFRGAGDQRQLRHSNTWYTTAEDLARAISSIEHQPGWTQHCALLRHAIAEAEQQSVQQVVVISDAFERQTPRRPDGDDFRAAQIYAQRLRDLGTTLTYAYRGTIAGGCPLDRAGTGAEQVFCALAEANAGAVFLLDPATLTERFGEIASQAALTATGDTAGAQLLLEHLQAVPFSVDTNTVGVVEVPRCKQDAAVEDKYKRINRAMPFLSDDVRYLLGRKVDLDFWYCQECSCEVAAFDLETPRRVRQRCANPSCGAPDKCYAIDDPYLSYVVKEVRWDLAINDCINAFGHSWLETWYYDAPRGH